MTNQASEDELNEILNQLTGWGEWVQDPDDGSFTRVKWEGSPVLAEAKAAIQSLIRTEKLKLLAEVRERVIGEDEVFVDLPIVDGTGKTISIIDRSFTTYMVVKNHLRAEQRTKLTKLEAGL